MKDSRTYISQEAKDIAKNYMSLKKSVVERETKINNKREL